MRIGFLAYGLERPPAESEVSARLSAAAIERQLAIRAADRAARAAALDAQGIPHDALEGSPLELSGDGIAGWNSFLDTETLFPLFGLPRHLPA